LEPGDDAGLPVDSWLDPITETLRFDDEATTKRVPTLAGRYSTALL